MMRNVPILFFVLFLVSGTQQAAAQSGYLGKKNFISIDLADRLLNDAWSLSLLHCMSNTGAIRVDLKYLTASHQLLDNGPGWLGLFRGSTVGTVTGSGMAAGIHYSRSSATGISAPQGYYMSFGAEFFAGSTHEKRDPSRIDTQLPMFLRDTVSMVDFKQHGLRLIYGWGVRHVLAGSFMIDAGIAAGITFLNTARSTVPKTGPMYMFPYEKSSLHSEPKDKGGGKFSYGASIVFAPTIRVGWLF